eukprot:363419-Chlamydomonas_euryale.AAC.18
MPGWLPTRRQPGIQSESARGQPKGGPVWVGMNFHCVLRHGLDGDRVVLTTHTAHNPRPMG